MTILKDHKSLVNIIIKSIDAILLKVNEAFIMKADYELLSKIKTIERVTSYSFEKNVIFSRFKFTWLNPIFDDVPFNDIFFVKIEKLNVYFLCSIYSDYGIDTILEDNIEASKLNEILLDNLFKDLYLKIFKSLGEHLSFYL